LTIPQDDTSGTVLAHLWEAVESWENETTTARGVRSDTAPWSDHSVFRWLTGWDRGVVDANCGRLQYAPIQANVLGVKPKQLTYSMGDAMAGFALHRMLHISRDENGAPGPGKNWQRCNNHPGTNAWPDREHGFMNGHGCALWSYGFDELFTKEVVFHRAVAERTLYSAIPRSSASPQDLMLPMVDDDKLRCSNAFFLDAV